VKIKSKNNDKRSKYYMKIKMKKNKSVVKINCIFFREHNTFYLVVNIFTYGAEDNITI